MTRQIRTRFAPSPTGYLHVGGARTALFSWLYARHFGGVFILRIEDTDLERSTDESIQAILTGMEWLNLDYDEGPFYQTKRFDRYAEVILQMLKAGTAYKCYCTKERLDALREEQQTNKIKPRYDGYCLRHQTSDVNAPHIIRFRNPQMGEVSFEDGIRGKITFQNSELDDLIIARGDGTPTYNFTVVIDDWDMKITHVIRGDDHINNTPRQINILKALGAELPIYSHVPMILGSDGKRLSKRHGAVSVMQYLEAGILPEALLNYLVRLGWASGDKEIFSREEMIQLFDGKGISRSPAAFDYDKLLWLNQHYMKSLSPLIVAPALKYQLQRHGIDNTNQINLEKLIEIQAERTKSLSEMVERSRYFFDNEIQYDAEAVRKHLSTDLAKPLQVVRDQFNELSTWQAEAIHQVIIHVAELCDLKLGKLAQPIRVAVTGNTTSPPIDMTLLLIGKERVLQRLDRAIELASS